MKTELVIFGFKKAILENKDFNRFVVGERKLRV